MLVVPMKNHIDEVIGVIQLINSKEDIGGKKRISGNEAFEIILSTPEDFETKVVAFDANYEDLMVAVANQAAIAIENNRMIKQIQNQFEEFVKASVIAIESRDMATSGHSFRVAEICIALARAINEETGGEFRDAHFSETEIKELEYAALLHDFGKVYIDLAIFIKGKKLYPKEFENLVLKLNYLYRYIEHDYFQKETALIRDGGGKSRGEMHRLEAEKDGKLGRIVKIKEKITLLNEPLVTEGDPDQMLKEILDEIERIECLDMEGSRIEIITESEKANLRIKRGSLNPAERREIESHVVHTYNFVSRIPWPPEFKRIPEIVLEHHEKLDGTGYPNGIKGKTNISLQARMMTIADVFDALVARDRPYKKSIPLERALAILEEESRNNKIDQDLLDIFIKRRVYEQIDNNSYKKQ
jgi:HD-GYP domain-containing protein (c-di-GMP phosphodiesterase class II)